MIRKSNILMVCYYFPPIHSVGVLRNYYLHIEFLKYFNEVHVLTTSNRKWMRQDPLPLRTDFVYALPTVDYRSISNFITSGQIHFAEEQKMGWRRKLLNINNSFPFNLLFGEGGLVYILSGFIKAMRLVRKHKITLAYSSFMPYADHVIAYSLKKFHPKITWIADFRDLHVDPIYRHVILDNFQHRVWRKLLADASLITTVSEGLASNLKRYHSHIFVMRNGFIEEKIFGAKRTASTNKFTFCYTGSMFKDERNPVLLLSVLRRMFEEQKMDSDKVQICYAGKDSQVWMDLVIQYGLTEIFTCKGIIDRNEARQLQHGSHINLLLTSSHPELGGVLTGKFNEYLQAGRPILALINGSPDKEIEELYTELNAGLVAYNNDSWETAVEEFILNLYCEWLKTGDIKLRINKDAKRAFYWDFQVEQLLIELQEIPESAKSSEIEV